ncbi:MAG TPA: AAA family ATPase [Methanospirillum sp.]|nr:AAA family ATPase [Methanospirillum sp.]
MKIISTCSFKGGCGKSTIAANLAYLLAKSGKKVCILDSDASHPSLHLLLGPSSKNLTPTFSDYILDNQTDPDCIIHDISSSFGLQPSSLSIIPSRLDSKTINNLIKNHKFDYQRIRELSDEVRRQGTDILIIDTTPELDSIVRMQLLLSNLILLFTRIDEVDIWGTIETIDLPLPSDLLIVFNNVNLPSVKAQSGGEEGLRKELIAAWDTVRKGPGISYKIFQQYPQAVLKDKIRPSDMPGDVRSVSIFPYPIPHSQDLQFFHARDNKDLFVRVYPKDPTAQTLSLFAADINLFG